MQCGKHPVSLSMATVVGFGQSPGLGVVSQPRRIGEVGLSQQVVIKSGVRGQVLCMCIVLIQTTNSNRTS